MYELNEIGKCYFAALVYGLSIINEKEREKGLPLGTVEVDGNALAVFVRRKGDKLVHHFMNETAKTHGMRNDSEVREVADELRRLNPGHDFSKRLPRGALESAQRVLPKDRQRPAFSYSVRNAVVMAASNGAPQDKGRHLVPSRPKMIKRSDVDRMLEVNGNGAGVTPSAGAESLIASLSQQITAAVVELTVSALEQSAAKLKGLVA